MTGDAAKGCPREGDNDRGVATVYACLASVVLLMLTGLAVHLGAAVVVRQRAESGADLAALAGAAKALSGQDIACAAATRVAAANGCDVNSCSLAGTEIAIVVTAGAGNGPLWPSATGRARAGPVDPDVQGASDARGAVGEQSAPGG